MRTWQGEQPPEPFREGTSQRGAESGGRELRAVIDREERDEEGRPLAVLVFDDEQQLIVPLAQLPAGAGANQVVVLSFRLDPDEARRRAARISALQRELLGDA